MEAARSFLKQLEARRGREEAVLASEFSDILARSAAWRTQGVRSTKAGSRCENVRKNRYKDVVPYDQTRVILSLLQEEGLGDYINASFIQGADGSRAYIATQGPLPHTLIDFWRLVWEFGVKVILMACRETENGQKKCERYWAQKQELLQAGLFCITLTKETQLNADIILRTLQVTFQKESRLVHQLQYLSWPDRGAPSNPNHMLSMVKEARRLQGSDPGPLCVHCSAGCGRTGVLCTVDYVRQLLLAQRMPSHFSLFQVVLEMRKQRPAAVQTKEQYRFLYHTVVQLFHSALRSAGSHGQGSKEAPDECDCVALPTKKVTTTRSLVGFFESFIISPLPTVFHQNWAPLYEDALSLRASPALPLGGVLRSISVPGNPALPTTDMYAAVQKRPPPAGARTGTQELSKGETPVYSQVTPRAQRAVVPVEDSQGVPLGRVPDNPNPARSDAYEEVADGAQTGGLGFNLRIRRPKGPRDPPAEWTRV